MMSPGGYVYEGDWVNGVKEGMGTISYPDGATYQARSSPGNARAKAC